MLNCLIDTNVIIDYFEKRKPFYKDADRIFYWTNYFYMNAFISAKQASDVHYILSHKLGDEFARQSLKDLWPRISIEDSLSADLFWTLQGSRGEKWKDFEDCLIHETALRNIADYIITRDVKDFKNSMIKVITPADFVQQIGPTLENPFEGYKQKTA
jgi:predicted nucleic acid-binding protein